MTAASGQVAWIGVDWGTTRMRAWGLDERDEIVASAEGPGMNSLAPDAFEPALLAAVGGWLEAADRLPVVVCGMAGARQGWVEAPYVVLPATLDSLAAGAVEAPARDGRLDVRILPGLCRRDPRHPDVMRGEETQLAGCLAARPGFAGVACLPGTHSKWVRVADGRIIESATFLTGELFGLLARHSVLRHSAGAEGEWDEAAFLDAARRAFVEPGRLSADLFAIRARDLLFGATRAQSAATLSGLLIGVELAAALEETEGGAILLIGEGSLTRRYARALSTLGRIPEEIDGNAAVQAGLRAAYRTLFAEGGTPA